MSKNTPSYEGGYYTDKQRNFKRQVSKKATEGTDTCRGCILRDSDQVYAPQFGAFDTEADLMVIAETPGTNVDDTGDRGRLRVQGGDRKKDTNGLRFEDYDRKIIEEWSVGNDSSYEYINKLLRTQRVPRTPEDVYYTNAMKCPKYSDEITWDISNAPDCLNQQGRNRCRSYLEYEIDELVDPEVIVAFGNHAKSAAISAVGGADCAEESKKLKNLLNQQATFPTLSWGTQRTVIPSYHWSKLHLQLQWINWLSGGNTGDYWDELGKVITTALS